MGDKEGEEATCLLSSPEDAGLAGGDGGEQEEIIECVLSLSQDFRQAG